jgi:hypothetical protein
MPTNHCPRSYPVTTQRRQGFLDEAMPLIHSKKRQRHEVVQLRQSLAPPRVTPPVLRLAVYCSALLMVSFANGLQILHGSAMVGRVTFGSERATTTTTTTSLRHAFSSIQSSTFITSTAILKSQFDVPNCIPQSSLSSFGSIPSRWSLLSPSLEQMQYHHQQQVRGFMTMGKGDGKKKRPKKSSDSIPSSSASSGASSSASASSSSLSVPKPQQQPAPLRVSTNINIPVKHQIMYAKFNKQVSAQGSPGYVKKKVERTAYRRTWGTFSFLVQLCAFQWCIGRVDFFWWRSIVASLPTICVVGMWVWLWFWLECSSVV